MNAVSPLMSSLPVLHAGHPIWYRGELAAIASGGEVYSVGWLSGPDRQVVRAMALAAFDAPQLTSDQQLSFAAYYLLPEERWDDLRSLSDDLAARVTGLPIELVERRRTLPSVRVDALPAAESICA